MYFIISYLVPQQRTVHWDDHQTVRNKSSQKHYLRLGVYGLHGEFERLASFQVFIISPETVIDTSFLVHPNAQKAWKFLLTFSSLLSSEKVHIKQYHFLQAYEITGFIRYISASGVSVIQCSALFFLASQCIA